MSDAPEKYTRSGVRRAGDDYQDVVALDLLVSMLEHPGRYEWLRVEADDFGYLDDVVALRIDGTIEAKQVKFSAHPEDADDPYDWNDLTAKRKGKEGTELPSLVGKWGPTLLDLFAKYGKVDAALVTNRRAAPDMARCIDEATNRVRPERVSCSVMDDLTRQLGGSENAIRFLTGFGFKMDRPGLATWETGIHDRFSALKGEYVGWLNLKERLRTWVREKTLPEPDGRIRLADVQRAALWRRLEALPQGFSIPTDYVLPSKPLHESVLERLTDKTGTCLVITGTPGVGKSTYLSVLRESLRGRKQSVVRHHYFLSLSDTTVGRFEHARVIESLMADLQTVAAGALGAFEVGNPSTNDFSKWFDACSAHYSGQEFPLVIMVDGLDHVWRERQDTSEMTRLFENLLPCRPGICLVVGTQPLADASLPKRLLDAAPRDNWITLPQLDRQAVLGWTRNNEGRLDFRRNAPPDDHEEEFREIASAFFDVSQGQPLLLRYGLNALIETGIPVNARSIRERTPVAAGSISAYYRSLWNGLSNDGRFILCMITSSGFEWPQFGIVACCARHRISHLDAERCWLQVVHMMCRVPLGWRPFHSSLGVFVTGTQEYGVCLNQVRNATATWLAEDAPDYWRWAYTWTVRAEMGDPKPLLAGTTREWAVESIAKGFPHTQVCTLMGGAATQALISGDFEGFAHKALLFEYLTDAFNLTNWDSQDEWSQAQLACSFVDRLPDILFSRRNDLTDWQLATLAEALRSKGDASGVAKIVEELIDRVNTRGGEGRTRDWISAVTPIVWTGPLVDGCDAGKIAERIKRSRKRVDSVCFSRVHAEALRAHRRADLLRQLCDADLSDEERRQFLRQGFLLALEESADWSDVALRHSRDTFAGIYAHVAGLSGFATIHEPFPPVAILSMRGHGIHGTEPKVAAWLENCFDLMLSHYLCGRDVAVQAWLSEVGGYTWPRVFVQRLAVAARELATAILAHRCFTIADLYGAFSGLTRPQFNDSAGGYEFWELARQALCNLGLDSVVLADTSAPCIGHGALEGVFGSPHCSWAGWIREYVHRRRPWMSADALDWIASKYGKNSSEGIENLAQEGISEATVIASLLALHGRRENAFGFLRRAVDLTLTYGYHKDILLHDYVETIGAISGRHSETARQKLRPVIPAILHVSEFTDGKETRHVPNMLFDLLATLSPEWLPPIYRYLCREEAYQEASAAFRGIMKSLAFASPVEVALGSTCLDKEGLKILAEKADQGCAGARHAHESVRQLLGRNAFPVMGKVDKGQTADTTSAERSAPANVTDYPPDRVQDYWKKLRECSYGRGAKELKVWADHWEQHASLNSVRDALVSLHEVEPYAEVANTIHAITVRLQGRAYAWPWLVKAHKEVNGWSEHWSGKEDALEKWDIVKRHYSDRWLDFIVETMAPGRWSRGGIGIHGCFPRLVDYLLLLRKEVEARSVVQGVREMIVELTAPFGLRQPDWLDDANSREGQVLEVLLSRMKWPSGMVRERACNSLAVLLTSGQSAKSASEALLEWMRTQDLESVACLGLLPFLRARQLDAGVAIPDAETLHTICTRPSLLYEILFAELFPNARQALPTGIGHTETAPSEFLPGAKFKEQFDHMLPAMYRETAASIERLYGVPFHRQWAYEVEHTGDGLQRAKGSVHFWGRSDGEHYVAFDTPLSEGLRSGYLRALAWLAEKGEEQRFWAMVTALKTLPVDIGLWQVSPQTRPDWWPVLESPEKSDVDTVPAAAFGALDNLWMRQRDNEWLLGMASGRIAEGGVIYDLDVFGVFQKCLGSETPEAEAVWQSEPWLNEPILLNPILSPRFSGTPSSPPAERDVIRLGDWMIRPSVLGAHPHVVPRWQWWRFLRGIWLPLPALARSGLYRVDCEQARLAFHDEDGDLGFWQDWTGDVSEMQDAHLTPRTGQVLMLRRSAVQRYAATNGLAFCWVCRIRGFQKEHGIGKHDEFSVYRVIGGSRLII